MDITKVLACGSIDGKFSKFFKKVSNVQKKNGPFELVICSGNFFSSNAECKENWKAFVNKKEKVYVPVYLLGPSSEGLKYFYGEEALEEGEEIYENVLYLGRKGIFKTASGLVIAYCSGNGRSGSCSIKKAHVDALIDQFERNKEYSGIDILITTSWPQDITKFTNTKIVGDDPSPLISHLAASLKPRYHLSCHKEYFFERVPYRNHQVLMEQQLPVSRFISLAPLGNPLNEKFLYALSFTPLSSLSHEDRVKQPAVVTEFPYKDALMALQRESQGQQQFFFAADSLKRKNDDSDRQHKKAAKGPPSLQSDCWFCLGSKDVEKHLVLSVGDHCYMALAKGAINEDHALICPVNHHNSTVVASDTVVMEMEKFKMCIRKMFREEGKEMITYERNFYTQHLQLQVIGIPFNRCKHAKGAFLEYADEYNLELLELSEDQDISQVVATTTPYFMVELPSGERLLHKVKGKMPLQFGREVISSSSILNLPDRVCWKQCKVDKEEESEMAKKFRKRFRPFDFNFT